MRSPLDTSTLMLAAIALVLAAVAYLKDPGVPVLGARAGLSMLAFVLPPMVVHCCSWALCCGIVPATVAGMVVPGGPLQTPSLAFPVIAGWLVSVFDSE